MTYPSPHSQHHHQHQLTPNTPPAFKLRSKIPQPTFATTTTSSSAASPIPTTSASTTTTSTTRTTPALPRLSTSATVSLKKKHHPTKSKFPQLELEPPVAISNKRRARIEDPPQTPLQNSPTSPLSMPAAPELDIPLKDDQDAGGGDGGGGSNSGDQDPKNATIIPPSSSSSSTTTAPSTPLNNRLIKPEQAVFHTTGLLSRRIRSRASSHAPETPCKRPTLTFVGESPEPSTSKLDMPPTPTRSTTPIQIRTKKQKGVFTDSPVKSKRPNLTIRSDFADRFAHTTHTAATAGSPVAPTTPISTDSDNPLGISTRYARDPTTGYFHIPAPPLTRKRSNIFYVGDQNSAHSPTASFSSSESQPSILSSSPTPRGMIDFSQIAAEGNGGSRGVMQSCERSRRRKSAPMVVGHFGLANPPKTPRVPNPLVTRLYTSWPNFLTEDYLAEMGIGEPEGMHFGFS
ncbi:hypothetical protein BC938DRAFT_475654 [Jimgerdemannia flammicorona]|uniref:Uncharacterized protein n=1 Tax=Jimgerdemannia flammicorona TaxID=994334 RepID=A0A433PQT6_9FUNG|nr:hypothetical protein BC938DRAFT_475654 [Jimgerdemannia flammicorona]